MKAEDFKLRRREVLPTRQTNVHLGIESLLMTSYEINFSSSDEESITPMLNDIEFDVWHSWN
jgi:hypothetical protein